MAKKANVIYHSTRLGELFPTPPCSFAYDYFKLNYSANYSRVFVLLTRYISRLTRARQKKLHISTQEVEGFYLIWGIPLGLGDHVLNHSQFDFTILSNLILSNYIEFNFTTLPISYR